MGAKIEQKSIKKGVQHGKASWHRFLNDFGGFLEASWGRKSNINRSKKAFKKAMENILDLEAIWERFGSQVGTENEAKMNTKRHAKNDAKMMGVWVRPRWGGVYPFPSLGNTRGL